MSRSILTGDTVLWNGGHAVVKYVGISDGSILGIDEGEEYAYLRMVESGHLIRARLTDPRMTEDYDHA